MKPTYYHYLLAHTVALSGILGIVSAVGFFLFTLHQEGALVGEWPVVGWMILAAIPITALGWMMGVIVIGNLLSVIAARLQGWPFAEGDQVVILTGKNRGTITHVYEVWASRGQVCLELGDEAKESVTDVYSVLAITRTKSRT